MTPPEPVHREAGAAVGAAEGSTAAGQRAARQSRRRRQGCGDGDGTETSAAGRDGDGGGDGTGRDGDVSGRPHGACAVRALGLARVEFRPPPLLGLALAAERKEGPTDFRSLSFNATPYRVNIKILHSGTLPRCTPVPPPVRT